MEFFSTVFENMSVISIIMLVFAILGAADRILGNKFGLGAEFDRGFNLLGAMALSMVGMISLAPLLADILKPCFDGFYKLLRLDPSIIPGALFANDMGGDPLAREIMRDEKVGMLHALVTSSMMGCTISFTIPYAMGIVEKSRHKDMFFGMLCGIITIPLGCFVAGLVTGIPLWMLLYNLLPLFLFSGVLVVGLLKAPKLMIKIFNVLGVAMRVLITAGLILAIFQDLTKVTVIKRLGSVWEGADVCFRAAMTLAGAFPFMFVVAKLLQKPIGVLGKRLKVNETAAAGFVATIVSCAPTIEMVNRMDKKGIVLNAAFFVPAGFALGGHLAYTNSIDGDYVLPMLLAKLVAGLAAVAVALFLYKRAYKED